MKQNGLFVLKMAGYVFLFVFVCLLLSPFLLGYAAVALVFILLFLDIILAALGCLMLIIAHFENRKKDMKAIEVVAAIIVHDGKVFATQRGYGEWKDWWEFPGGKIEPGENHADALCREIREELATEIAVGERLCTVEYDYPNFHLTMHCYRCSVVSGELTLLEHEDARWLAPEELDSVKWLPADVDALRCVRNACGASYETEA